MKLVEALSKINALGIPFLTTGDVAALLKLPPANASKVLERLQTHGFVTRLARAKWGLPQMIDPLAAAEFLTSPLPAYISLQTALFHHGLISQIPSVIYALSLARTRRYKTPLGVYSIHHIEPELFFGYDVVGKLNIKIASPEKALLDLLYLSPARSGLFQKLPEVEFSKSFHVAAFEKMVRKIPSIRRRSLVKAKFEKMLNH
jgi:predicted transcriptional regulator of viral defense system